ncbi:MAG: guanine deaminase [Notoacmeibacter sp.]
MRILRGRTLSFHRRPEGLNDHACHTYREDGALLVDGGMIIAEDDYSAISKTNPQVEVTNHHPHLIMAGFIDPHLHFPQMQVIASFGTRLIEWLNTYTFPEEMRFSDKVHADRIAYQLFATLIANGTTTAAAYCTSHPNSVDAFFEAATARNMRMIGGKVLMDRNAPAGLLDTPNSAHDDTLALAARWHGKGRAHYCITPRFAITSTQEQMEVAQTLVQKLPDCYLQTHLGETPEEIAFSLSLYPGATDYAGIYESYGLLGPKTLLGHCIHLTDREVDVIAATKSIAVSCPTSNLFLGSGLFPRQRLLDHNVRIALATDIGGGTSYSMLQTLDEFYKVLQLGREVHDPLNAFYQITLGNAQSLGLADKIGTLEPGTEADIVVLNANATAPMALRMERASNLNEELFVLQTLGDDRAVVETYVAGKPLKQKAI